MAKLTLAKLAKELNANNIECSIGKNVDKIFLENIKEGFMAYIFEGDNGFVLVVRLRDENKKAIDHKTYSDEQKAQCDEQKAMLIEVLNEAEVYEFKGAKKKDTPTEQKADGEISDIDLLNSNLFNE
ncbi:hypothetical protein LP085_07920 [Achromobacter sp. MY14]|uniref:hypothetical protein n=1 Tax=unclassified Achromobacter TaxID=2626865 RepID=UPI001E386BC1|nr:hypothetical protein [Achromobacter sp. MY14]MCD0496774.1 hypothetical protein [Achromobacter sp. MY14]